MKADSHKEYDMFMMLPSTDRVYQMSSWILLCWLSRQCHWNCIWDPNAYALS